jgi:hypothetical protein
MHWFCPAQAWATIATIIMLLGLSACGEDPKSPEIQLREHIATAETAAENRDLDTLRDMVAEQYSDDRGLDKETVLQLLRRYFFRHRSIYLLTRIQNIDLPYADQAQVSAFVAMAGQPIDTAQTLRLIRADLYRFDLVFKAKDQTDWQVINASWRRAKLDDFW